ncbi:RNA degradosome polyphosphate kinase [uncultured Porphyromonas sp.]|uniref:RNA degradosome polyphosphate kinase n=1 Tax=uncultured Porphyromonas sp. TaxID=159274 RepID=UPI0028058AEB|nr:RNA degradosome polyphosphate kinase [uncultured Porphyromonas sp.]
MGKTTKRKVTKFPYIDRDISWMSFNRRILLESAREDVPLMERLNFLGIYSNNLDEFFRVRVASLRRIAEDEDLSALQRKKAERTLRKIYKLNKEYAETFEENFQQALDDLTEAGIRVVNELELTPRQEEQVFDFYIRQLGASTNPLSLRKMDFSADQIEESIYLAVQMKELEQGSDKPLRQSVGIIKAPVEKFGRFIRIADDEEGRVCIMFLDDVIRFNLKYIFAGLRFNSFEAYTFKFTKDAEMDIREEDVDVGVVQRVSKGLRRRRKGEMLRVVYDADMPGSLRNKIFRKAGLDSNDAKVAGGRYHNLRDLMDFPKCGRQDLCNEPQMPILGDGIDFTESMIDQVLHRDRHLHFPYHSFNRFLRLLREAAISDEVRGIKCTLYRVAKDSNVINTLIAAAKNGKKVTVVVELLARFDEESNIAWAKEMIEAGINVLFGPETLKIHSKLVHITTRHGDIACIGTGNMHEGTARVYTDVMLMTANKGVAKEVADVFKYIEKPYLDTHFKELLVSPNDMRRRFIALINREIKNKLAGKPAYIMVKVNHIVDPALIKRLYAASQAGVDVDLLVRGNCSLVPGVKGVSENIRVYGIIDRYLEHSRIFIFCNNDDPLYFIGSADWMQRNLDRRIEVVAPVYDKEIQRDLHHIVACGLQDVSQGHYVNSHDGRPRREEAPTPWYRSQTDLYAYYLQQDIDTDTKI